LALQITISSGRYLEVAERRSMLLRALAFVWMGVALPVQLQVEALEFRRDELVETADRASPEGSPVPRTPQHGDIIQELLQGMVILEVFANTGMFSRSSSSGSPSRSVLLS
jgi:hypothetical protein